MAAVSGSENAPGPWYVSKHLSLDAPPSAKQTASVLILALPGPGLTIPVEAVVPVAVHAAAAEDGVVVGPGLPPEAGLQQGEGHQSHLLLLLLSLDLEAVVHTKVRNHRTRGSS